MAYPLKEENLSGNLHTIDKMRAERLLSEHSDVINDTPYRENTRSQV